MLEPLTLAQWRTALRSMGIIESNIHGLIMFFTNNAGCLRVPCTQALLELGVTSGNTPNLVNTSAPYVTREYWNAAEDLRRGLIIHMGQGIDTVAKACLALRFFRKTKYRELMLMDPDALRFLAKTANVPEINTAYALALCVRHVIKEVHCDYQSDSA